MRHPLALARLRWLPLALLCGVLLAALPVEESSAATPADPDQPAASQTQEATEANAPQPPNRMQEVVITASRVDQSAFDAPFIVNTITAEKIRDESYRTTPEALRDIPGIMVQKTGLGQGSPYIRGFTGYHTLYLIDGIRLNNSVFRSGPNQYATTIDPLSIDRLEVVQGTHSVLYGTDAIGGTVNAITKGPRGYGEGFKYGGQLTYRLSSAEQSEVGRTEVYATWDHQFGLYFGGSVKDFGDLIGGRDVGRQRDTGYDEWDVDFKTEYFFNPDTKLVFAHQSIRQNEVPRTHKTIYAIPWEGLTVGTELRRDLWQQRDLTYVQLLADNLRSWVDSVKISLSWQEQDETQRRLRTGNRRDEQGVTVGTLGASLQLENATPVGRLTYGIDYYHDTVNAFASDNPIQGPVGDDAAYDLLGIYLQDTIPLSNRLDLILGGRYELASARANEVQDPITGNRIRVHGQWDALVGSSRLVYHVDAEKHWNVFGGVSQGFRAPNLSDLTRFDEARTKEIETPSPGVGPEHFVSYEVGTKADYDNFGLQLAYFYTQIQDMIIRAPTGRTIGPNFEVTKRNAGDGFIQGIEVGPSWRFHPDWTAFGALTWLDGEVDAFPTAAPTKRREPVSRLMPTTALVGLRWDHPKRTFWTEVTATFAAKQDNLATSDILDTSRIPPGGTPGYAVLSLRTGWKISQNVRLTAAIENITNEDYRIHGSGVNEPGRNFLMTLEVSF